MQDVAEIQSIGEQVIFFSLKQALQFDTVTGEQSQHSCTLVVNTVIIIACNRVGSKENKQGLDHIAEMLSLIMITIAQWADKSAVHLSEMFST